MLPLAILGNNLTDDLCVYFHFFPLVLQVYLLSTFYMVFFKITINGLPHRKINKTQVKDISSCPIKKEDFGDPK